MVILNTFDKVIDKIKKNIDKYDKSKNELEFNFVIYKFKIYKPNYY